MKINVRKDLINKKKKNKELNKWLIGVIEGAGEFIYENNKGRLIIKNEQQFSIDFFETIKKILGNKGIIDELKKERYCAVLKKSYIECEYTYTLENEQDIKNILFPIMRVIPLLSKEKQLQYLNFYNKIMEKEEIYCGIIVKKEGKVIRVPEIQKTALEENIYVKILKGEPWENIMKDVKIEDAWIIGIMNGSTVITCSEFEDGKTGLLDYSIGIDLEFAFINTQYSEKKIKKIFEKNNYLYRGSDKEYLEEFFNNWECEIQEKKESKRRKKENTRK